MHYHRLLFALVSLALAFTACKKTGVASGDRTQSDIETSSIAAYNLLEEVESEDSYVASEMSDDSVQNEIKKRAQEVIAQVDDNKDGQLDATELAKLKTIVKDKMLEKFDVDSNGSFSQAELEAIQDKLRERLEEFKKTHPEGFAEKRQFICKILGERSQNPNEHLRERPLFEEMLKRCHNPPKIG